MLNFKPEGGGELVESSDDLDAVNGADMEDSDIDSDDSDSDDDTDGTDAEDIADVGEEAGSSKTKENLQKVFEIAAREAIKAKKTTSSPKSCILV